MTDMLLYSAEPVFEINRQVRGELTRDLLRLDIREDTEGLRTLVARLAGTPAHPDMPDVPEIYLDGSVIDFGQEVTVSMGASGSARSVFTGFVSAIEAVYVESKEPEVVIFAEDRLMKLRTTRRFRSYEEMTDAGIAEEIASEHGLDADVAADGPTYDVVQQWNQSDLAFLRERAARIQAEVWIHDDTLHFQTRENRSGTEITLLQGNQLTSVQLRADLAHQRTIVKVAGYDADQRDGIDEEARGDVVAAEARGGRTGPDVLERAFGERVSFLTRDVPLTDGEAIRWARAEMLRRSRGFVTATGTTNGTPDMVVGSRLTLQRVGGPFNGDGYYVVSVAHTYDRHDGYRTHFTAERATVNEGGS
jgi:phage protein D